MFGGRKKLRHIVVSHASADRSVALALIAELEAAGIRVWVSPRDVNPLLGTATQTREAIRGAVAVLLLVSTAANESKVLKNEAEIAVGRAPIIPVRIEDVLPRRALRSLVQGQPYDLFGAARANELDRLIHDARQLLGISGVPLSPAPPPAAAVPAPEPVPDRAVAPVPIVPIPMVEPASSDGGTMQPDPPPDPPYVKTTTPLTRVEALRQYVGYRADRVLDQWREMDLSDSANRPFLSGLLFGRYWLAWRKVRLATFLSSLAATGIVGFAFWIDGLGLGVGLPVAIVGLVGLALVVWLRGLSLYRANAERRIERWNRPEYPAYEAAAALRRRGGVSVLSVLVLAMIELVVCLVLAVTIDPSLIVQLMMALQPRRQQEEKLDLVDMTKPADPKIHYSFCIRNPTDLTIAFTIRTANGAINTQRLGPHSDTVTFSTRSAENPAVSFDHVLGDGEKYTERTYALDMARTDDERSCGGMIYYFTTAKGDVDLKREEQMLQ